VTSAVTRDVRRWRLWGPEAGESSVFGCGRTGPHRGFAAEDHAAFLRVQGSGAREEDPRPLVLRSGYIKSHVVSPLEAGRDSLAAHRLNDCAAATIWITTDLGIPGAQDFIPAHHGFAVGGTILSAGAGEIACRPAFCP